MGILDRIFGKTPQPVAIQEPRKKAIGTMTTRTFQGQQASKLAKYIGGGVDYTNMTETERRELNTVLFEALPPMRLAAERFADFIGKPKIESASESTEAALNEWLRTAKIQMENNPARDSFQGIEQLVKVMVQYSFKTGMVFIQDNFEPETQAHRGILIHDSSLFDFAPNNNIYHVLRYRHPLGGVYIVDENSKYWTSFGFNFYPDSLWGVECNRGAEFISRALLKIVKNHADAWGNYGNPIIHDVTGVNLKSQLDMTTDDLDMFKANMKESQDTIVDAYQKKSNGESVIVFTTTGADVTRDVQAYGADFPRMPGFSEDFNTLMPIIALVTGIPPDILGVITQGGGLSGEKFRLALRIMRPFLETVRSQLKPVLKRHALNWLEENGYPAMTRAKDAFEIEFEDQDYLSPEEKAASEKTKAETYKIQLENLMQTASEFGLTLDPNNPIIARAAKENNLEWLIEDGDTD